MQQWCHTPRSISDPVYSQITWRKDKFICKLVHSTENTKQLKCNTFTLPGCWNIARRTVHNCCTWNSCHILLRFLCHRQAKHSHCTNCSCLLFHFLTRQWQPLMCCYCPTVMYTKPVSIHTSLWHKSTGTQLNIHAYVWQLETSPLWSRLQVIIAVVADISQNDRKRRDFRESETSRQLQTKIE